LTSALRALFGAAATALLATAAMAQDDLPVPGPDQDVYADMELFGEIFDRIRQDYVDAPDEKALLRAAIGGMLTSLDPHSNYLPPQDYVGMQESTSGEYGGVGLRTQMVEGVLSVSSPIEDTPASRADIRQGDIITAIDGQETKDMSHDDAVQLMRGPVGQTVTITVQREGVADPFEVAMKRAMVTLPAVRWSVEEDVALIQLSTFSAQAGRGVEQAIERIYAQRDGVAPKGIILDLRNNLGGLVDQAVLVADVFLHQGAVVWTRGRVAEDSARYDAQPDRMDERLANIPMVVLINGASASASEIVAGALQDHKRATLIGTRSFGKGSVQSVISLGAEGAMRLTTARYYTPGNRSIQAFGIVPDIQIEQVVPPELEGRDLVVGEAGLAGHITIAGQEEWSTGSSAYVPEAKAEDTQLQYAIRLINGAEVSGSYPPAAT